MIIRPYKFRKKFYRRSNERSRPLYFYVKLAHVDVIPGIREFLAEYTSEDSWGPGGYLEERGMIPMPKNEREFFKKNAEEIIPLTKL